LLAGDAERWTWNARCQQVYTGEILVSEVSDVLLDDVPMGSVFAKCGAKLWFVLDSRRVVEASQLKAKGLTTTACAKFQNCKTHLSGVDSISTVSASVPERD
jgi:hypothetical protein